MRHELEKRAVPDAPEDARKALFDTVVDMGPEVLRLGVPHCAQAVSLTRRLPVPSKVPEILACLESRWNGQHPVHPPGPQLPVETRIIEFAVVTDNAATLGNFDVLMSWLGDARPPQTLITVSGLAFEGLVVEISGKAAQ